METRHRNTNRLSMMRSKSRRLNANTTSATAPNRRELLTTAQSIRSFLETGSVIAPSEDGRSVHESYSTLDVFDLNEEDDENSNSNSNSNSSSNSNRSNGGSRNDKNKDKDEKDQASERSLDDGSKVTSRSNSSSCNSSKSELAKFGVLEAIRVRKWRLVVIVCLLSIGVVVSTLTYASMRQEIEADSNDAFLLFADTMRDAFTTQMRQVFTANRALSRSITTAATNAGATESFPYFIVPSFEVYAHEARLLSHSDVFMYAPIVDDEREWSRFATQTSAAWWVESKRIYDQLEPGLNRSLEPPPVSVADTIFTIYDDGRLAPWKGDGILVPSLHTSPPPMSDMSVRQNINLFSNEVYKAAGEASMELKDVAFTPFQAVNVQFSDSIYGSNNGNGNEQPHDDDEYHDLHPHSVAAQPVYRTLDEAETVGFIYSIVAWKKYLAKLLPSGAGAITVVLKNTCDQVVTYVLRDDKALYVGEGDLHDRAFSHLGQDVDLVNVYTASDSTQSSNFTGCAVTLDVYPTREFVDGYSSPLPGVLSAMIAVLFGIMAAVFAIYDRVQSYLNTAVVDSATRSNAIVASLFPSNVRDRLLAQAAVPVAASTTKPKGRYASTRHLAAEKSSDSFLMDEPDPEISNTKPIADLFPATTVLFADIVGFTAWSSTREPGQVFTLLETVYQAFDEIASKRGIFKVETIGDCYVAVCGLPDPTVDHAVSMAQFARKCLIKMWSLVKKLETSLGPDTSDLTLRIGMHSGPVTAGVLRGERSRFQLFGDTVNTASRMESTGMPNCIQLSQETANLLDAAGKSSWIKKRADNIHAKGKGLLQTYFLELRDSGDASEYSKADLACGDSVLYGEDALSNQQVAAKNARLVAWNTTVLFKLLKQIAAKRVEGGNDEDEALTDTLANESIVQSKSGQTVLDEVKEIIALPGGIDKPSVTPTSDGTLDPEVGRQLHSYLTKIASMYPNNPFHNFDHATHVAMSVVKLLSRIIAPSTVDLKFKTASALIQGDHTYGITSDPLTQFSCVLSALIHDVDHRGVPNAVLVKEQSHLATRYNNKSIAEQNSVDLAWDILMQPRYSLLRNAIYSNDVELRRFRQLIVNSVMATDIVDAQQKEFRNARWDRAFCTVSKDCCSDSSSDNTPECAHVAINRKATIVIEHLIQASDVAHTMQHWHIYRKWNERFFKECYQAYRAGRTDVDPTIGWYKGEIGFFDFYIIPLAKKLKDCGVFGVSSDEYLNYAVQNRQEWESRGQDIVARLVEKYAQNCTRGGDNMRRANSSSSKSLVPRVETCCQPTLNMPQPRRPAASVAATTTPISTQASKEGVCCEVEISKQSSPSSSHTSSTEQEGSSTSTSQKSLTDKKTTLEPFPLRPPHQSYSHKHFI